MKSILKTFCVVTVLGSSVAWGADPINYNIEMPDFNDSFMKGIRAGNEIALMARQRRALEEKELQRSQEQILQQEFKNDFLALINNKDATYRDYMILSAAYPGKTEVINSAYSILQKENQQAEQEKKVGALIFCEREALTSLKIIAIPDIEKLFKSPEKAMEVEQNIFFIKSQIQAKNENGEMIQQSYECKAKYISKHNYNIESFRLF